MVEVCGVKYVEGIGKNSGKPYKAYLVCYMEEGRQQGYDGYITGDAFVSVDLLDDREIKLGDKLNLFYNKNGYLMSVEFCC